MAEQRPPDSSSEDWYRKENRDEKEEKEEKGRGEKREKEEKGANDRLGSLSWAVILVFAGIVLLVMTGGGFEWMDWANAWSIILVGAGLIVGLEVVIRFLMPEYRAPLTGRLVLAVILILVGGGSFIGWDKIWPIALIGGGIAILVGSLLRS